MAIELTRESFDKLSDVEKWRVINEDHAIIYDPEQRAAEARRKEIQAELAAERKRRTIKRSAFDKMAEIEKTEYINGGGLLED